MLKKFCKYVAVLVLLLPLATAQQSRIYRAGGNWEQEVTGSIAAAKNLHVKVDVGSVKVQGGSQQGISYVIRNRAYTSSEDKARREFDAYKISVFVRGDTAWVVAEWQGNNPRKFSGEFNINVPREMDSVKVETDGGSVTTTGIAGRADAETGGGSIHMDDIGGSVNAETGGDSIEVGSVGGDLNVQTGGGRVYISSVKGKINASTGGGDIVLVSGQQGAILEAGGGNIQVKQCGGKLKVSTGGGNIELGDVAGSVEIETGGGSIRLGSAKGLVRAETGAGRIELNDVPSARAETGAGGILARFVASDGRDDSMLETSVGDIVVYLAPGINITVRASIELANGHNIRSDFSEIRITSEGEWGARTVTAEGNVNGGGPVLKVRTTTGNISFLRASR
jgi:hypothetical protein